MKLNDIARVINKSNIDNDQTLESNALSIIKASNYQGAITKISDGIFFVGFKDDKGWVTQGYKEKEIEVVK